MAQENAQLSGSLLGSKFKLNSNIVLSMGLVAVFATLLYPLPPLIIDFLIIGSISMAVVVLVTTISAKEPMDLSTFPSMLLVITLFRLSLNVASTRQILLQGNAGKMISTFGDFVAGGNIVVGMVIFLILVLIQFIVITKGAERVSEVGARFTLDAMPGKQMAIDADLNAGNITDTQARERREKIISESEFYGSMDGASKFIRGDAMAGLVITAINLIGGIFIGYSRGMDMSTAAKTYCLLSIGDGLASQLPSIIISLSSGFLVTKGRSSQTLSQDISNQIFKNNQALFIASGIIVMFTLVPGFAKTPFFIASAILSLVAYSNIKKEKNAALEQKKAPRTKREDKAPVENLLDVDAVSVMVGVRLIGMVDPRKKSGIFERIGAIRRKFAQELGLIVPLVRLKDDINLEPNTYEIRIFDHVVASGSLEPERFLAMDSGATTATVNGIPTQEPVYGLPAIWITEEEKETAELNGYTVIDPESVLITHLSETLNQHAHEILTREDVQQLVERLRTSHPSLVGDVVGELVNVGLLQRVLQNLLSDRIPIRDLPRILESLSEHAPKTKNSVYLTELVRKSITRTITEAYKNSDNKIIALSLDPELEHEYLTSLKQEGDNMFITVSPEKTMKLCEQLAQSWRNGMSKGFDSIVLLCDSRLRRPLAESIARSVPKLPIVAYDEISTEIEVQPIEAISIDIAANDPVEQMATINR